MILVKLANENLKTIGAVRENRTEGANKKLKDAKTMKKSTRENSITVMMEMFLFCRWNDSSIVNIGSNFSIHFPVYQAKRRVKNNPVNKINQSNLIKKYNKGMGGVDIMDRLLGS